VSFAVCTALQRAGTIAVLTGGSAATYYAPQSYQSDDVDFIITLSRDSHAAASALLNLGFTEHGGVYRHPATTYTVEFPAGPLSIGRTIVRNYDTVRRGDRVLHVLTRTDTVRDRLAAFYHWDDRSSLRAALDVAQSGKIDLDKIKRWSAQEGASDKLTEFTYRYKQELKTRRGRDRRHRKDSAEQA
jgi:hypothetical protein